MRAIRLLLVEDSPADARLVREMLDATREHAMHHVDRLAAAMAHLATHETDVVVLDLGLSDSQGLETLRRLVQSAPEVPIIVLTGQDDEALGQQAVREGAQDYLVKGLVAEQALGRTVRYAIERSEAQARLRQSENELALTLGAIADGIWKWHFATNAFEFSPRYYTMLGYAPGEFPASYDSWCELLHPDDRAAAQQFLATQPDAYQNEFRLRTKAGDYRWIRARGRVVQRDPQGVAVRMIGSHEDITDRRQAEQALCDSEARLARAQRIAKLGHWQWDLASESLSWSDEIYRFFDLDQDAPLSFDSIVARVHPEDRAANQAFIDALLTGKDQAAICLRLLLPDGEIKYIEQHAEVIRGESGQPTRIDGTMQDISQRKRAEAALRDSEARHRALFESSADAMMTLEPPSWGFTSANPATVRMFGARDEADFTGRDPRQYSPEYQPDNQPSDEKAREMFAQAMRDGSHQFDWLHQRLDGRSFPASVLLTRVEIAGQPLLQATVRDQTQLRALQASLAQADRLSSMGMLAAGVAHEINNPLVFLLYNLESLAADLPRLSSADPALTEDLRARFADALEGARRITGIARALSTFSRVEADRLVPVDLSQVIEAALAMAFNEVKYRCRLVKDFGRLPPTLANDGRLSQVFLNLLINAAQSIDEGDVDSNEIRVRTWQEGDELCAEVSDTGKGIAQQDLPHLFEPFFTTKKVGMGTGLGLAISSEIIKEHGGRIEVTSTVGHGARFVVRLPLRQLALSTAKNRPADAPTEPEVHGRILVIDDEAPIRAALRHLLGEHEVVEARSGEEGRQILAGDQAFDLVLCDMMMPSVSGVDLHRWLATTHPELARRVVFVTGGAFTPKARDYLAAIPNLRLEKPFDPTDLRKIVCELVRATQQQTATA